jgi:hypothetical protein
MSAQDSFNAEARQALDNYRVITGSALRGINAHEKMARIVRSTQIQSIMLSQTNIALDRVEETLNNLKTRRKTLIADLNATLDASLAGSLNDTSRSISL